MIRKNIRTLVSGDTLSIPIFHFSGSDKCEKGDCHIHAPSLYLQSGIHGAEVQGYLVALILIEYFAKNPPRGDVTIVPLANPYGANCKLGEHTFGRFDPVTGDNWNRNYCDLSKCVENFVAQHGDKNFIELIPLFKEEMQNNLKLEMEKQVSQSYHKKLALELQLLAATADIVLDLHCDAISEPYLYSASYAMDSAVNLNFPFIIEIPHEFAGALDEATFCPWVRLAEHYKHQIQRPPFESFTIELGSEEQINICRARDQANKILGYLRTKGVCEAQSYPTIEKVYSCQLKNFITIYAAVGGLILDHAELGVVIKGRAPLMKLSNLAAFNHLKNLSNIVNESSIDIAFPDDCIIIDRICTANVHEGMALMKVMTNFKSLKSI